MKVRFAVSVGTGPPEPEQFGALCVAAEKTGFDTLWLSDVPSMPLVEPTLGVAFAAALTERIHLGVNCVPFGATPYLVAHRLAQLDRLSGGRLLVTLVPGIDPQYPGRMMDEVVPELRRLWAGGQSPRGDVLPVPPVQEPLEIWLGGNGPKAVARAGRLADGWLGSFVTAERAGEIVRGIQAEAAAAGRAIDPEHFGLSIGYAHDEEQARAASRSRIRAVSPDMIPVGADGLRRFVTDLIDQGLSKFVVRPAGPVGDWDAELAWMAETLLPLQN